MKKRILSLVLALLLVASILPAPTYAVDVEMTTESDSIKEREAKITSAFPVLWKDPTDNRPELQVSPTYGTMPAVVKIVGEHKYSDTLTLYKLDAIDGETWPEEYDEYRWMESTKLAVRCDKCGEFGCELSHENWCEICEKDECGVDHDATDPSNPTHPVDPDVPSISATVTDSNGNEQTVTVSGDALPKGAEIAVDETTVYSGVLDLLFEDKGNTVSYDISIGERQPNGTVTVTVSGLPFSEGETIKVIHYLDDVNAIITGAETGGLQVRNINRVEGAADAFAAEIAAGKEAEKQLNIELLQDASSLYFTVSTCTVTDGSVTFATDSFSVYTLSNGTWSGSNATTSSGFSKQNEILMFDFDQGHYGYSSGSYVVYATPGQSVYFDEGALGAQNLWEISGDTSYIQDWTTGSYEASFKVKPSSELTFYNNKQVTVYDSCTNWFTRYYSYAIVRIVPECTITYKLADNAPSGAALTTTSTAAALGNGTSAYPYAKIMLPTPTTPSGYTFTGWYDASGNRIGGAGSTYEIKGDGSTTSPKATVATTLYAKWEPIKYTVKFDPNTANAGGNTVTGSMSNISMTYDVATTLPRSKYVNNGDGYVFQGWATSPTGEVVYKDGAKVSNLTTTNNGTVTLYAKWIYGLNTTVHIGINNSYHNPNGTYKAGDVTIDSYHTYPNEPAQMTADFDRVTNTTGAWTFHADAPLTGVASQYINGNIFNSPDYEMTYVEGQNTLGLADPTGAKVKAMLKFSDADYNAMISAWLNAKREDLIAFGDVNFDWRTARAEDFTMVPYVIKFEEYKNWYIDMVVVPKALYTLAYDSNIENGYTASFSGVAFPPSTQHKDGDTVSVVTTPIGYQSNGMKVTKVVDGHTYEAVFQYWYDAEGNTYGGNTGKNTIKLTKDTILYAKWEYPDALYGNLEVTKTVVDKDSYTNPVQNQEFTFTFKTNASGSYNYTIYDRSANVKESGEISNNGTFQLQDGWRIRITDLPKDATYSVAETAVNYYTASGTVSGTISAGATTYATETNTYQKNAAYTVKHFLQNSDKNGYEEQTSDRQTLNGVINTDTAATAKTYAGYEVKVFSQTKIFANGTTVVEIFYDLLPDCTVTGSINNGGTVTNSNQTVNHGANSAAMTFTPAAGYKIISVTVNGAAQTGFAETGYTYPAQTNVTEDVEVVVTTALKTYTVTGSIDHGTVTNGDQTINHGGNSQAMVFTPAAGYKITGIAVNGAAQTVTSETSYTFQQTITEDTTVVVTTERDVFTVTWKDGDGNVLKEESLSYGVIPSYSGATPTKTGNAQYSYKHSGWTPEVVAMTGDATYTATFTQTINQYTMSAEFATPAHGKEIRPSASVTVNYGEEAYTEFHVKDGYIVIRREINGVSSDFWSTILGHRVDSMVEDIHIIAYTAPIPYTITYELDGGVLAEGVTNPTTYTVETETFTLNNPTKAGYKFKGWATSATATTGAETVTIEKGTIGNKTYYAVWERSLVDLTVTTTGADKDQSFIFTVTGTPSDTSYGIISLQVVIVGNNSVTVKDLPVGTYTVTEADEWSWRQSEDAAKGPFLLDITRTVTFEFSSVNRSVYWLSGYSYNKRRKGGS